MTATLPPQCTVHSEIRTTGPQPAWLHFRRKRHKFCTESHVLVRNLLFDLQICLPLSLYWKFHQKYHFQ